MRLFFSFEDNRINLLVYFAVSTIVLYLGPGYFFRGQNPLHGVPVVDAPCGRMAGTKGLTRDDREIYSYKGIPYARAPVGPLRFKRPQPLTGSWEGTFQATKFGSKCYQPFTFGDKIQKFDGSEDCLFINVHVPKVERVKKKKTGLVEEEEKGLPVMVYVHGGGFVAGDGSDDLAGPNYLLDRDVILVTMNYRLGPLGFFSLDDASISGNQGMWDQREALHWVQSNIRAFGGNPKSVTLFGESAGSMSVAYHLVAPDSGGLFQSAILQSGGLHLGFLSMDNEKPLSHYHRRYADKLGCDSLKDSQAITDCLQKMSVEDVFSEYFMFDECNFLPPGMMTFPSNWKPVNDAAFTRDPFFSAGPHPRKLFEEGKVVSMPVMMGFLKDEGLISTAKIYRNEELAQKLTTSSYEVCMAQNVFGILEEDFTDSHRNKVREISKEYFGQTDNKGLDFAGKDFSAITDILTECGLGFSVDVMKRSLVEKTSNKVFYYRFDHLGSFSLADYFAASTYEIVKVLAGLFLGFHTSLGLGVAHADDLLYVFSQNVPFRFLRTQEDEVMSRFMVDLWANFATYHDPTPKKSGNFIGDSLADLKQPWKAATKTNEGEDMAVLKNGQLGFVRDNEFLRRQKFWRKIYAQTGHM